MNGRLPLIIGRITHFARCSAETSPRLRKAYVAASFGLFSDPQRRACQSVAAAACSSVDSFSDNSAWSRSSNEGTSESSSLPSMAAQKTLAETRLTHPEVTMPPAIKHAHFFGFRIQKNQELLFRKLHLQNRFLWGHRF